MSLVELGRLNIIGLRSLSRNSYHSQLFHHQRSSSNYVVSSKCFLSHEKDQNRQFWSNVKCLKCSHIQIPQDYLQIRYCSKQNTSPSSTQKDSNSTKSLSDNDRAEENSTTPIEDPNKKLTLFQRIKLMYRDYWYILVPVHCITSAFWFGSFYYLAKSGVDIVAVLKAIGFSETVTNKLESGHSTSAYLALAYALYKIATPLRYTVTLGGTTYSINKLKELGYIKPLPPKGKLKEMYNEKKEQLKEKYNDNRIILQEKLNENKQFIQEKYSPEKCKKSIKHRKDKILNKWQSRYRARKVNGSSKKNGNDGTR